MTIVKKSVEEEKKPVFTMKRRFKPLKRDELKAKKKEAKMRTMIRTKPTKATPINKLEKNSVEIGDLEVVEVVAPEDIINEIYKKEKYDEGKRKKPFPDLKEEERSVPKWLEKERKMSVPLLGQFTQLSHLFSNSQLEQPYVADMHVN